LVNDSLHGVVGEPQSGDLAEDDLGAVEATGLGGDDGDLEDDAGRDQTRVESQLRALREKKSGDSKCSGPPVR
jgi:hypothetical protein